MSGVAVALTTMSVIASYVSTLQLSDPLTREARESFVRLFTLAGEANIPAWYASSTLLACSGVLATIALAKTRVRDRYARHWAVLSVVFLALSLDEAAILHEMSAKPLRAWLHTSGLLDDAWVIPGFLGVCALGVSYLRFLAHLPPETRRLFVIAGTLFLGGALGVEALAGRHLALHGSNNVLAEVLMTMEEVLEMAGVIVFIHALLAYVRVHVTIVDLRLGGRRIDFVWEQEKEPV